MRLNFMRHALLAGLVLILATAAFAGEFRSGDTVILDGRESLQENLTIAGETVSINGEVSGDIVAVARSISMSGRMQGQIIAAAQRINLNGWVIGDGLLFAQNIAVTGQGVEDFRGAAQDVLIDAPLTGELLVGAQTVTLGPNTKVAMDAVVGAQNLNIDGLIRGKLIAGAKKISISGTINGDADVWVEKLVFYGDGRIKGNLKVHYTKTKPEIDGSKVGGTVTFVKEELADAGNKFWPNKIWWVLAAIATGMLLLWGFKRCMADDLKNALDKPIKMMGFGFIGFIGIPVVAAIAIILVLTVPVGVSLLLVYFPALYFGWLIGSLLTGMFVLQRLMKDEPSAYLSMPVGIVLVSIIGLIPALGALFNLAILLIGLGAIITGSYRLIRG